MLVFWPVMSFILDVGEIMLKILDSIVGFVLYGAARLLLSWLW